MAYDSCGCRGGKGDTCSNSLRKEEEACTVNFVQYI
jgi:hypothetical protein